MNKRAKEGNRRRDSVEEEEPGRQEINSDTPLRETEEVIKEHGHIFWNTNKKWFKK